MNPKYILAFLLFILCFQLFISSTYAHPLDVTTTQLYIEKDVFENQLKDNELFVEVYLNWLQADLIVYKATGEHISDVEVLLHQDAIYSTYISQHLSFTNNGEICSLIEENIPKNEETALLNIGLVIRRLYSCRQPLSILSVQNTLLIDDLSTQQNYVSLQKGPVEIIEQRVLNPQTTETSFEIQPVTDSVTPTPIVDQSNNLLSSLTAKFYETFSSSLITAVFLVFFLGLLHTLEAGHSKTILASLMIEKKATTKQGLMYTGVFTITHIADILLLGIIFIVANQFVDLYSKFSMLQLFSAYALLFISLYLFLKNVTHLIQHKIGKAHTHGHDDNHDHEHHHDEIDLKIDFRKQLVLGFVAGLAPCIFGWSIFMVVLTSGKIWSLFPIIFSFGLGIFVALSSVALLLSKFKTGLFKKLEGIGEYSALISSLILLIYAISLLL